jgi:hypothetical protein
MHVFINTTLQVVAEEQNKPLELEAQKYRDLMKKASCDDDMFIYPCMFVHAYKMYACYRKIREIVREPSWGEGRSA